MRLRRWVISPISCRNSTRLKLLSRKTQSLARRLRQKPIEPRLSRGLKALLRAARSKDRRPGRGQRPRIVLPGAHAARNRRGRTRARRTPAGDAPHLDGPVRAPPRAELRSIPAARDGGTRGRPRRPRPGPAPGGGSVFVLSPPAPEPGGGQHVGGGRLHRRQRRHAARSGEPSLAGGARHQPGRGGVGRDARRLGPLLDGQRRGLGGQKRGSIGQIWPSAASMASAPARARSSRHFSA